MKILAGKVDKSDAELKNRVQVNLRMQMAEEKMLTFK